MGKQYAFMPGWTWGEVVVVVVVVDMRRITVLVLVFVLVLVRSGVEWVGGFQESR